MNGSILRVAINTPVMRLFDYRAPPDAAGADNLRGCRVVVPFGKSTRFGIVVSQGESTDVPEAKLKTIKQLIDSSPVLDESMMRLLEWAADYYRHPPGEVFSAAIPAALRKGGAIVETECIWRLSPAGEQTDTESLGKRALVQRRIVDLLREFPDGANADALRTTGASWRKSIEALQSRGICIKQNRPMASTFVAAQGSNPPPTPTDEQAAAIESIKAMHQFGAVLLEGVTGSGKTEVYLCCITEQLQREQQTLVIVPEIGLTPQLVERFRCRLPTPVAVLHSGLTDNERAAGWRAARSGEAGVVIGTRSAVFTALARPGLIVIDEEHDSSLKQQDGFRYSARDVAVWRARQLDIPIVLGSATPSFESIANVEGDRYRIARLSHRPGSSRPPDIKLIDLRKQPVKDGLTEPLRQAIDKHIGAQGQVLLYLNRRGFAPSMLCTDCGEIAECRRCDARMVLHQGRSRLICHHCGAQSKVPEHCAACQSEELRAIGQGTERLEDALRQLHPDAGIVRIDRDTTRRKGELERRLDQVRSGEAQIVLGTQMLTKGHDFPGMTLVGIIDADQGLFGTDFRSSERLAQSFVQVAGRAGRGERPGEVYIQTLFPEHPLLTTLLADGYDAFAAAAMAERRAAGWPPFTFLALLRAEATQRAAVFDFLDNARDAAATRMGQQSRASIRILGPAPAPMERRSGRYRGQLLLQTSERAMLQQFLAGWRSDIEALKSARRTRWSIDVDPIELI